MPGKAIEDFLLKTSLTLIEVQSTSITGLNYHNLLMVGDS